MKYEVGDRVRIKSIDWYNANKDEYGNIDINYDFTFYADRSKYCGKVFTITEVFDNCYCVKEDNNEYFWADEMIECLVEEMSDGNVEKTTIKLKDLRKFINKMESNGLNDDTVLTFETKRSSGCIESITSMEYSPTTNILIFS